MQPAFISQHAVLDFSNPLQRDSNKHKQQHQALSPSDRPRQHSPFGLSWERDPTNPRVFLEPPLFIAQNQLFTVEFRILFDDVDTKNQAESVHLIAYFYVQLHPRNNPEYALACEPIKTGRVNRVPLYIEHEGVYNLQIVIVPDLGSKGFRPAVYVHENRITVLRRECEYVPAEPGGHKGVTVIDTPERVDVEARAETGMVIESEAAVSEADDDMGLSEGGKDDTIQWPDSSVEPEEMDKSGSIPDYLSHH